MLAQERGFLDELAASSRLIHSYLGESGKRESLPDGRAAVRCLGIVGDMLNDLAALVVAQPERDPFRVADQQIVVAAYHWATATSAGDEFAAGQRLRAAVAAHNRLAESLATERS